GRPDEEHSLPRLRFGAGRDAGRAAASRLRAIDHDLARARDARPPAQAGPRLRDRLGAPSVRGGVARLPHSSPARAPCGADDRVPPSPTPARPPRNRGPDRAVAPAGRAGASPASRLTSPPSPLSWKERGVR